MVEDENHICLLCQKSKPCKIYKFDLGKTDFFYPLCSECETLGGKDNLVPQAALVLTSQFENESPTPCSALQRGLTDAAQGKVSKINLSDL